MVSFQSTLSLRRATLQPPFTPIIHDISIHALLAESDPPIMSPSGMNSNFNPRSPCGERLSGLVVLVKVPGISIHALLAESDLGFCPWQPWSRPISIHALLAESDDRRFYFSAFDLVFQSTLSLRRATRQGHRGGWRLP